MKNIVKIKFGDFDAAIFDMDGTMINNMVYHQKAWKEFTKKHGLKLTEEEFKEKFSGKKNNEILMGMFGRELNSQEVAKYAEEKEFLYRKLYAKDIKPVSGLLDLIKILHGAGKKLAVATTAPKSNRDFGFKALKLQDSFSLVLGEEDVTKGKPDPEIYLGAAKRLQVNPLRCIVFEDTPSGIQAGKRAGMRVIGILTTHTKEDNKLADYLIEDFTQIQFR